MQKSSQFLASDFFGVFAVKSAFLAVKSAFCIFSDIAQTFATTMRNATELDLSKTANRYTIPLKGDCYARKRGKNRPLFPCVPLASIGKKKTPKNHTKF